MKLIEEILAQLPVGAAEIGRIHYSVLDGRGGYFQNVKAISEFSERAIVLAGKRGGVRIEGERLSLGKYCGGDATVLGDIRRVERCD